jgi:hypothetical protein
MVILATADTALVKALAIDAGNTLKLNGDVLSGDAGGGARNYTDITLGNWLIACSWNSKF